MVDIGGYNYDCKWYNDDYWWSLMSIIKRYHTLPHYFVQHPTCTNHQRYIYIYICIYTYSWLHLAATLNRQVNITPIPESICGKCSRTNLVDITRLSFVVDDYLIASWQVLRVFPTPMGHVAMCMPEFTLPSLTKHLKYALITWI